MPRYDEHEGTVGQEGVSLSCACIGCAVTRFGRRGHRPRPRHLARLRLGSLSHPTGVGSGVA